MSSPALSPVPDILSPSHAEDPYATYRAALADHPVFFHEGTQSWILSRHADLHRLFREKTVGSENYSWQLEPVHGRTILQMEGKEHSSHRRLLTPFFHRDGLERFKQDIRVAADDILSPAVERERAAIAAGTRTRGEIDLVADFTESFPLTVIERMLDLPGDDHAQFERWYTAIMDFLSNLTGADEPVQRGLAARKELAEYMLPIIAERREGDGQDLISRFGRAEVDGERLTDDEIRAFISLMLPAGGETTDKALANMFRNLLEHPDQLAAVRADRSLVLDALAETLRCTPPVHMIMRQPNQDIEFHGVTVPAGSTMTCLLAAANRDPRKFDHPDEFDIFRQDNSTERAFTASADHFAFVDGRHFCVGAMLARNEVEIAANMILDQLQDMQLAETVVDEGVFTRAPTSLRVSFVPA